MSPKTTYTVTGNTAFDDHQPGETFEADLDEETEARLLERGQISKGKAEEGGGRRWLSGSRSKTRSRSTRPTCPTGPAAVEFSSEHERIDVSGFNATGANEYLAGATEQSVTVEFFNGYGAGEPHTILYPIHKNRTTSRSRGGPTRPPPSASPTPSCAATCSCSPTTRP